MISLKKFLSKDEEAGRAMIAAVRILMQGIGEHSVAGEVETCVRFRDSVQEITDAVVDDISPDQLLVHANSVVSALDQHNRRVTRQRNLQLAELQNMVKMLTSTVGIVSSVSDTHVKRLSEIEHQIVAASALDDVRSIKAKLSDCLKADIQKTSGRRNETGDDDICRPGLEQARNRSASFLESTTGTRLPAWRCGRMPKARSPTRAGSRLNARLCGGSGARPAADAFNVRFGREVGDEVLTAFSRMIQKTLHTGDRLFRWSGPTLVALLPRSEKPGTRPPEIARIVENLAGAHRRNSVAGYSSARSRSR